jgi:hypothetical protein
MKKTASILLLVFAFSINSQGQTKEKKHAYEKVTVPQQAALKVKKMTLKLDLSEAQQREMMPIITKQIENKNAGIEKRKTYKKNNTKPTEEERYAIANERLDEQISFKNKIKKILTKEQFEKFEKMKKSRKEKMGKKVKSLKKKKQLKAYKEEN